MSKYTTVNQITPSPKEYFFSNAQLLQLRTTELKKIAFAKGWAKEDVRRCGDLRSKLTWQIAILEAQAQEKDVLNQEAALRKEEINHPVSPSPLSGDYPTKCSECPFARSLGGDRYACSHNGLKDHEVVRGHWLADPKECYSEIDKAIAQKGKYSDHYLNDQSNRLNKVMRSEVNPDAIAWFVDRQQAHIWNQQLEHERETEEATAVMEEEVTTALVLQSEAMVLSDFCKKNQIEFIEKFTPPFAPYLVVRRTALHAKGAIVCRVHYFPDHWNPYYRDKFQAKGSFTRVGGDLESVLLPFIRDFDKPFLAIGSQEVLAYA